MTNGKKDNTNTVGSFKLETKNNKDNKKIAIKANNTFYWFAEGGETLYTTDEESGGAASADQLITLSRKVTAREMSGCAIIDLGYSTNLTKSNNVAFKVTEDSVTFTNGTPSKKA